jgi:hypothetical protein
MISASGVSPNGPVSDWCIDMFQLIFVSMSIGSDGVSATSQPSVTKLGKARS